MTVCVCVCCSLVPMAKARPLVFDLAGEGNLPSVTVVRPSRRTSRGEPLLQFRHLLGTHTPCQTLLLKNDSNIPAQVTPDLTRTPQLFGWKSPI